MQNKCDLAQEMYETIIETPNVPNSIRANAYKQLGEYKLCQLTTGSWGSVYKLCWDMKHAGSLGSIKEAWELLKARPRATVSSSNFAKNDLHAP